MSVRREYGPVRKFGIQSRSVTGTVPGIGRYESSLERDLCELVRDEPDFQAFHYQPLRVRFAFNGKEDEYTPDALIEWKSQPWILAEVKYRKDIAGQWREFRAKFRAAQSYAKVRGWKWAIYKEEDIRTTRLFNVRFLHGYLRYPVHTEIEKRIFGLLKRENASVADIVQKASGRKFHPADVLPAVWRLVARRQLAVDMDLPITNASIISASK